MPSPLTTNLQTTVVNKSEAHELLASLSSPTHRPCCQVVIGLDGGPLLGQPLGPDGGDLLDGHSLEAADLVRDGPRLLPCLQLLHQPLLGTGDKTQFKFTSNKD